MAFTPFPAATPPTPITSLTEKVTPIGADEIQISDSEDSDLPKKVQLANLPYPTSSGSVQPDYIDIPEWHVNGVSNTFPNTSIPGSTLSGRNLVLHTFTADTIFSFEGTYRANQNMIGVFPQADGSITVGPSVSPVKYDLIGTTHTENRLYVNKRTALAGDKLMLGIDGSSYFSWEIFINGTITIWDS
jgi:hypothetical protein